MDSPMTHYKNKRLRAKGEKMYLVKKYQNRKLYLPALKIGDQKVSGRYITFHQLLELDKEQGVQVINDKTKEDITDETLLSAIFEFAKQDLILKDSLLSTFREDKSLLPKPCFLLEAVDKVKVAPALNTNKAVIDEKVIDEKVVVPENAPVTETQKEFSGF